MYIIKKSKISPSWTLITIVGLMVIETHLRRVVLFHFHNLYHRYLWLKTEILILLLPFLLLLLASRECRCNIISPILLCINRVVLQINYFMLFGSGTFDWLMFAHFVKLWSTIFIDKNTLVVCCYDFGQTLWWRIGFGSGRFPSQVWQVSCGNLLHFVNFMPYQTYHHFPWPFL